MEKKLTMFEARTIMDIIAEKLCNAIGIGKTDYSLNDITEWVNENTREIFTVITEICDITEVIVEQQRKEKKNGI